VFNYFRAAKPENSRVLAILSSESDRAALRRRAALRGDVDLIATASWDEAVGLMAEGRFTVILCDRDLPVRDWRESIRELAQRSPCVLLVSSVIDDSLWQEVVECGGYDIVRKPLEGEGVFRGIDEALRYAATTAHVAARR
jgi:DNA-binding NarL/FixJ family response regulator